ncbi:hypothetical protein [Methylovulum psychrotolerans]|uniref:hypothetical protein n=1 Tax=Methylovulum psychrotolerans TaxID=1704499 RepID=UPI0018E01F6D|nr:hypothetical protein [Methylovulum psychrotolerans]
MGRPNYALIAVLLTFRNPPMTASLSIATIRKAVDAAYGKQMMPSGLSAIRNCWRPARYSVSAGYNGNGKSALRWAGRDKPRNL